MNIDELKHRIKTLDQGVDVRLLEIVQHRRSITRLEASNRADLREMRRLQQSLDKLEDDAISASISESISEARRPGITAFTAEVRRLLTNTDGSVPHDADALAKMLYTSARIQVHLQASDRTTSEANPHLGGTNQHYLARTLNRLVFGLEGDVTP